jgi:hypothetical protein
MPDVGDSSASPRLDLADRQTVKILVVDGCNISEARFQEMKTAWLEGFEKPGVHSVRIIRYSPTM